MGYFEIPPNGKSNFKTIKQAHSSWLAACSLWDMLNSNCIFIYSPTPARSALPA